MSITETVPDVEVDESELTQQPCTHRIHYVMGGETVKRTRCSRPSVGEDFWRSEDGHEGSSPHCQQHIGQTYWDKCGACCQIAATWLVISRYYTRRAL